MQVGARPPRPVALPTVSPRLRSSTRLAQGRRGDHRAVRAREPGATRGGQRPDVGTHRRLPVERPDGGLGGRPVPPGRHHGRDDPADRAGREGVVLVAAVLGGDGCWPIRRSARAAPTSSSIRRCRCRRRKIAGGTLTAPLVYVGAANPSVLQHIDVKGKIAVQLIVPQGHMLFERGPWIARRRSWSSAARSASFNLVRLPGNERSRDFSDCGNPVLQHRRPRRLVPRDGASIARPQAGVPDKVRVRIEPHDRDRPGLKADERRGGDPRTQRRGHRPERARRAWFDGAGDNADGLAVLVALARHFAEAARTARAHAGVRGQRRPSHARHQRAAQLRRRQSRPGETGGDAGEHRARGAAQLLAGPDDVR